jgi:hypothetical protein
MREHPDDLEVMRAVVEGLSKASASSFRGTVSVAALKLASGTEGPIDEAVARALVSGLYRREPENAQMIEIRKILAERYPDAAALVRPNLASDHFYTRWNAYRFLQETAGLTPAEEFQVHFLNLVGLRSTVSREAGALKESLAWLDEASEKEDWEARKKAAGIERIEKLACMRSNKPLTHEAFRVVGKAFWPEIRESVLAWTRGEEIVKRHSAYLLLKHAGRLDEIDLWAFHANNLILPDYRFLYSALHEALAFFREKAGTDKAAEAKALLEKARAHMAEHAKDEDLYPSGNWRRLLEKNIQACEEALQAFE